MSKPVLILVSGWAHPPSAMNGLAAALSNDFFVIATSTSKLWLEARADPAAAPYVDGLVSLLRSVGRAPVVAGWSMGGMVALEAAVRRASLISALVLVGASAKFCSGPGYRHGVPVSHLRAMAAALKRDRRLMLKRFLEEVAAPTIEPGGELDNKLAAACSMDVRELSRGLEYLQRFDVRSALKRIRFPTLVAHGKGDRIVPWEAALLLNSRLTSSRLLLDNEAGHAMPLQKPYALALEIRKFLGACK